MKKKKSFALSMASYAVVFLGVILVLLLLQWRWISEYEAAQSKFVIEDYVKNLTADKVRESCESSLSSLDTNIQPIQNAFDEYIRPYFDKTLSYYLVLTESDETTECYEIRSDDTAIGCVVLKKGNVPVTKTSRLIKNHEIYRWEIISEDFNFSFLDTGKTAQISVPLDFIVECRGYRLGTRYITSKDNHYPGLEYLLDYGIELPYMATYTVSHFLGDVSFTVYDADGNQVDGSESFENILLNNCTDAEMTRLDTFIHNFCKYYVAYMGSPRRDIYDNYNNLTPYLLPDSEFAKRLFSSLEGMVWSNNQSNEITDLTINYCINAGNGNYIAEVDYNVKSMGASNEFVTTRNYVRVFVKWTENGLYAYDMMAYKNAEVIE